MENKKLQHSLERMTVQAGSFCIAILFYLILDRAEGIGTFLGKLYAVFRPLVIGFVIAYLLKPVCVFLEKQFKKIPQKEHKKLALRKISIKKNKKAKEPKKRTFRLLSSILAVLFGIFIVYILMLMIIPQMYSSIISLSNTLPSKTKDLYNNYIEKLNKNPQLLEVVEGIYEKASESFSNWVRNTLLPQLTEVIGGVGSGVKTLMISIKDIVMGLVVAIYVLNARVTINSKANRFLYGLLNGHRAGLIKKEVYYANSMFSGFMGGKLLDSAIIGLICYIFCLISKMPNTLLVSAIVGLTNVVPVFGPFIGAIPTSLLILIEDPVKCLIFVIFIIILQQFDGNLIGPAILGKGTGLSSFEVLVSILVFGGLFGFIGMIIGVPLYATLSHITRQIILFGLKKHGQGDCIQAKQIVKELEEMENGANLPLNKDWENL